MQIDDIMEYDISVSGHKYRVSSDDKALTFNGQKANPKITKISENEWSVLMDNRCLTVIRSEADNTGQTFIVNGKTLKLNVETELGLLLGNLGMDINESAVVNEITAPMPGAILEVIVKAGQEVQEGEKLLVLEAMKMENIIKSPTAGIITSVTVTEGDNVEKGQSLITF